MDGWIKLHREISDHKLWLSEPFNRAMAWVDMLILANHKPGYIRRRGVKVNLYRGELGMSLRELAKRWKWSIGRVQRFLDELKMDTQIDTRMDTENASITSVIIITNYEKYQSCDTETGTETGTETIRRRVQNKNVKNKKKESYAQTDDQPDGFASFWSVYPKKVGKQNALRKWQAARITSDMVPDIIAKVEEFKDSRKWREGYILDPERFIAGRRWEDDVEIDQPRLRIL